MKEVGTYLVAGLGLTGCALVEYFIHTKTPFIAFEELSRNNYEKAVQRFGESAEIYFENIPFEKLDTCTKVFISPGIPLTRPWIQEVQKKNIPITGELEFASLHLKGEVIAVTGTNGKSTTVSLLDYIFKQGGRESDLKGNIGFPLITAVTEPPREFYVVEVSSFQLETAETFRPKVSVILNITDDHLDRYDSFHAYVDAKAQIFKNQGDHDFFIYNADDPYCRRLAQDAHAKVLPFSLVNQFDEGGFVEGKELVIRLSGAEHRYQLDQASLRGLHNQENMLAALLSAKCFGISDDIIKQALQTFKSLPHRVEFVGNYHGVSYYDDSKATNVGSVVMSIASFEEPLILILGGRDKNSDFKPLQALIDHKVKGLILLGEASEAIAKQVTKKDHTYFANNMEEAVKQAKKISAEGDVVLLSPACASFDQYKNYSERGRDFVKWVRE